LKFVIKENKQNIGNQLRELFLAHQLNMPVN